MLNFVLQRLGPGTPDTIKVEVSVWADGADGVQSVSVYGSGGGIWGPFAAGCSPNFATTLENVPRSQLPLIARATDCSNNPQPVTSAPFLGEERTGAQQRPLCPPPARPSATMMPASSETTACREAQDRVGLLRNQILGFCQDLRLLTDRRNAYLAAWTIASTLAIAALVAAVFMPFPFVKIALYIVAAILAAVAIAFLIAMLATQAEIEAARGRDAEARQQFRDEVSRLSQVCCPDAIRTPLNEPTC